MGLEKVLVTIEGTCDWCKGKFIEHLPAHSSHHFGVIGQRGDFCSDKCYKLWEETRRSQNEKQLKEYIEQSFLGGYNEYEKARCFLCGTTFNLHDHHIYGVENSSLRVRLCFPCHVLIHKNAEVRDELIEKAWNECGMNLKRDKMVNGWGRRKRKSEVLKV